jgi:hypothetical protein
VRDVQQLVQHVFAGECARVIDRRLVRVEDDADQGTTRPPALVGDLNAADALGTYHLADLEMGTQLADQQLQTVG